MLGALTSGQHGPAASICTAAAPPISAMPKIPEFPTAVPEIPVSDLASATKYYRDNLKFNIDWIAEEIALAGVSRGDCRLFLAGPTFRSDRGKINPVVTWLNMGSSADVDDIHEAWRASNTVLLSAPQSNSWGLHEFSAADLDGNEFRVFYDFATPERERGKSSTV